MNLSNIFIRSYVERRWQPLGWLLILLSLVVTSARAQPPGNANDPRKQPTLAWTFVSSAAVVSSPAINEGVVYFGSEDSTWYALELATGKLKWKLATRAPIRSTPYVYGGQVFLAGGNGVLTSVDKITGAVLWRIVYDQTALFMGERSYDFADYYHSSPIVENGIVYLGTGNGVMGAYLAKTGALLWRYQTTDIIHCRPVIAAGKIILGSFDGYVHALDKTSGQLIWKFKTVGHQYFPKGEVQGMLATDGHRVFVGARDYNLYAIDVASGTASWNMKFSNGWAMSATVADTVVYIGTSDDRVMVAADARSGREYWRTNVNFNIFGGAISGPRSIVFGTIWGKAYALDRRTGAVQWTFETQAYRENHLRYFNEDDHFRADIGSILRSPFAWIHAEHQMGGIFSTPAISGDFIVFTTTEGKVYALKP